MLFILARPLFPIDNGRKVRLYKIIRAVHEMGIDVDIAFFTKDSAVFENELLSDICTTHFHFPISSGLNMVKQVFIGIIQRRPLQISIFQNKRNRIRLQEIIKNNNYDFLYFDMLRTGIYVKNFDENIKKKSVIDIDDLLSKRYGSEIGYNHTKNFNLYGKKTIKFLYRFLGKFITRYEANTMANYERSIVKYNTLIALVSNKEKNELIEMTDEPYQQNIIHIPLTGTRDKAVFRKFEKIDKNRIGFIGNLTLKSNFDGLCYFIEQNSTFLSKETIKIDVIGYSTASERSKLYSLNNEYQLNIQVRGYVPKLDDYMETWLFAIAPNRTGTGINTKIYDYLSFGLPIVGYNHAFRGFEDLINRFLFPIEKYGMRKIYEQFGSMTREEYLRFISKESNLYNEEYSPIMMKRYLDEMFKLLKSR